MPYDNSNSGVLYDNKKKKREGKRDPDYKGSITITEPGEYWLSGWIKTSEKVEGNFLSLSAQPKAPKAPPATTDGFIPSTPTPTTVAPVTVTGDLPF